MINRIIIYFLVKENYTFYYVKGYNLVREVRQQAIHKNLFNSNVVLGFFLA